MKKAIVFLVGFIFVNVGSAQIIPISNLKSDTIIEPFQLVKKHYGEKHLYILFEENNNASIYRSKNQNFSTIYFQLSKFIPEEDFKYFIGYYSSGELYKAIPGVSSCMGDDNKISLVWLSLQCEERSMRLSQNLKENMNILHTKEIEKIRFSSLRNLIRNSDIIDILLHERENKFSVYRVKGCKE